MRARTRRPRARRSSISRAATSSGGRAWPQARAPVVAEVADVGGVVPVRVATAHAVLRVGCVLERRRARAAGRRRRSRSAPLATVRELGDERVVGVGDERRVGGEARDRGPPALGDVLELAVAVELVPEEVAEADGARPDAPHHLGQRELVDLEQPEVRVAARRGASTRPRRRGWRPSCSRRGGARARGSRSPSPSSSSCRSSPRRAPHPGGAGPRARRARPGSSFQTSLPGRVVPPPRPAAARAAPRAGRRTSRARAVHPRRRAYRGRRRRSGALAIIENDLP